MFRAAKTFWRSTAAVALVLAALQMVQRLYGHVTGGYPSSTIVLELARFLSDLGWLVAPAAFAGGLAAAAGVTSLPGPARRLGVSLALAVSASLLVVLLWGFAGPWLFAWTVGVVYGPPVRPPANTLSFIWQLHDQGESVMLDWAVHFQLANALLAAVLAGCGLLVGRATAGLRPGLTRILHRYGPGIALVVAAYGTFVIARRLAFNFDLPLPALAYALLLVPATVLALLAWTDWLRARAGADPS